MSKHGTFGRSMSRLKSGFDSLRWSDIVGEKKERERLQQEKRKKAIEAFLRSFEKLKNHPIYLTADDISSLDFIVNIEEFQLRNDDAIEKNEAEKKSDFFTPMTKEALVSTYEMNLQSKKMADWYSELQKATDEGSKILNLMKVKSLDMKPEIMCSRLRWGVEIVPRMGTEDNSKPLRVVTGWRETFHFNFTPEFVPFVDRHTLPPYGCQHFWTKKGYPHVKMCMHHGNDKPVKYLLLGEFLTIVATICTRLIDPALQNHAIVPVMMFSFIAPQHGRLILSHFDGNTLFIRMSETLEFSSKDEEAWETFIRYAAADVNSEADTSTMA
ncbi:hypothetical protein PISL3812_06867 [Talaromyces islandicus]|uniref:Uncharacterized protein n=1 Tax=Talaromyces islandicus TaxID=28573 RepID=A0A0U1M2L0_TALIS|nr:hypothetical protein PISL3812_06867 [Talaromyces islandicus]